ncbi:MAG: helix-turn-helix transcriptional regulator [Acidimicrobiia bacterium]
MGSDRVPWDQFIGQRIRQVRQNKGWTQERLALEVQQAWDLAWTRATVTATESGQRELSAKELFALLDVLVITPAEFLADPSTDATTQLLVGRPREMAKTASITLGIVRRVLGGSRTSQTATGRDTPWTRRASQQIRSLPQISGELEEAGVRATASRCMAVLEGENGEAEKKLAAQLGTTPRNVAIQAIKLWDRTLTAERDARLEDRLGHTPGNSAGSLRTIRGHITRQLITELTHATAGD